MSLHASQPIGIFDSGVGGLTVAHALTQSLPDEKIIYFGDVAHHPYGEKSPAALQSYTLKICDMLLAQNVKLILIACNSASSVANEVAKKHIGDKAMVVNVIDPTIEYLQKNFTSKKVGLIATRATINSNVYQKNVQNLAPSIYLQPLATPLLAPMIEEGFAEHIALEETLKTYLSHPALENIEALLLACTHYPVIKSQITRFYNNKVTLIDNSEVTAHAVKELLNAQSLLNTQISSPTHRFYVSDYTDAFIASAHFFFPTALHFEYYPLWD